MCTDSLDTARLLNQKLIDISEELVDCTEYARELPHEKESKNIFKIGKAIAEINDLRTDIYSGYPELMPEGWNEPPTEQMYAEWYEEALRLVEESLELNNGEEAIDALKLFISIGPSEKYKLLAKGRMDEIRAIFGT